MVIAGSLGCRLSASLVQPALLQRAGAPNSRCSIRTAPHARRRPVLRCTVVAGLALGCTLWRSALCLTYSGDPASSPQGPPAHDEDGRARGAAGGSSQDEDWLAHESQRFSAAFRKGSETLRGSAPLQQALAAGALAGAVAGAATAGGQGRKDAAVGAAVGATGGAVSGAGLVSSPPAVAAMGAGVAAGVLSSAAATGFLRGGLPLEEPPPTPPQPQTVVVTVPVPAAAPSAAPAPSALGPTAMPLGGGGAPGVAMTAGAAPTEGTAAPSGAGPPSEFAAPRAQDVTTVPGEVAVEPAESQGVLASLPLNQTGSQVPSSSPGEAIHAAVDHAVALLREDGKQSEAPTTVKPPLSNVSSREEPLVQRDSLVASDPFGGSATDGIVERDASGLLGASAGGSAPPPQEPRVDGGAEGAASEKPHAGVALYSDGSIAVLKGPFIDPVNVSRAQVNQSLGPPASERKAAYTRPEGSASQGEPVAEALTEDFREEDDSVAKLPSVNATTMRERLEALRMRSALELETSSRHVIGQVSDRAGSLFDFIREVQRRGEVAMQESAKQAMSRRKEGRRPLTVE